MWFRNIEAFLYYTGGLLHRISGYTFEIHFKLRFILSRDRFCVCIGDTTRTIDNIVEFYLEKSILYINVYLATKYIFHIIIYQDLFGKT